MRRYLALDIGEKRTGVALVDDSVKVATPLTTIHHSPSSKSYLAELTAHLDEWEIQDVIVGLPINLAGKESIAAVNMRETVTKLMNVVDEQRKREAKEPVTIYFVDERMTTAQAEKSLHASGLGSRDRKNNRDALAAALIAQSFIDSL